MGEARDIDLGIIGVPNRWYVVFNTNASTRLRSLLAFGKYKHVRAFGYVPLVKLWVFYDVKLSGTDICLARDAIVKRLILAWLDDGCVIEMPVRPHSRIFLRLGFWCVPAIKHLLGMRSSALRPDRLRLHCLKSGGRVIYDGFWQEAGTAADCAGSDVRPVAKSSGQ